MFCTECGNHAANKAIRRLEESGQVGRVETQKTVLAQNVVTTNNYTTEYGINGCFILPEIAFEADKKYKVVIDDTVAMYNPSQTEVIHVIGNLYLLDGMRENTAEPYLLMCDRYDRHIAAVTFADPAENEKSHTVAVYELSEIIHPIDQKYLPGVCLPVVELSTEITTEIVTLTDNESAQVAEAMNSKCFIVLFNAAQALLCRPYDESGISSFQGSFVDFSNGGVLTALVGGIQEDGRVIAVLAVPQ